MQGPETPRILGYPGRIWGIWGRGVPERSVPKAVTEPPPPPPRLPSGPPPAPFPPPSAPPGASPRLPERSGRIPGVSRLPRWRRGGGGAAGEGGWRRMAAAAALTPDTAILESAERRPGRGRKARKGGGTARQWRAATWSAERGRLPWKREGVHLKGRWRLKAAIPCGAHSRVKTPPKFPEHPQRRRKGTKWVKKVLYWECGGERQSLPSSGGGLTARTPQNWGVRHKIWGGGTPKCEGAQLRRGPGCSWCSADEA